MARIPIPDEVAAKAIFYSDRICCVCRTPKKPIQIHHIDDNNSNNVMENLAVLCLDCHTETQIKGGFGRRLDSAQVKLYRDEWLDKVGRYAIELRKTSLPISGPAPFTIDAGVKETAGKHKRVESQLEHLEEINRLVSEVIRLDHSGDTDSRDKLIDRMLLNKDVPSGTELYLRAKQGKVHLVDRKKLDLQLDEWKSTQNWSSIARAYGQLGMRDEAAKYYCLTAVKGIENGNSFTAGYYLTEMIGHDLVTHLFEHALQQAKEKGDIWWQIRSLQELNRDSEIDELVLQDSELIEQRGRPIELSYLQNAQKRREKILQTTK